MLSRIVATASLATALLLPSCATVTKMPLSGQGSPAVDKSKAIFLITATTRNIYKASYQPKLLVVNVERDVVNGSQDRLNFKMDDEGRTETRPTRATDISSACSSIRAPTPFKA